MATMPTTPPGDHPSVAARAGWGRSLREAVPRGSHGVWEAPPDRADPVDVLLAQNPSRVQVLVPIRHERMMVSPFTFYRGGAAVMAGDLASTPTTGLRAQICGDAHLANFGVFGSPERALVFDVNDFDETHPGPWEWDVKRLAVSAVLLARDRGFGAEAERSLAQVVGSVYRLAMADFASKGRLEVWYSRMTDQEILSLGRTEAARSDLARQAAKARRNDVGRAVAKYTEVVNGRRRFVHRPPLVMRLEEVFPSHLSASLHEEVIGLFAEYLDTLPESLCTLIAGYELVDVALKVVGVGSVGTRCFIALASGRDDEDLFIFQVKEAQESVLAPYVEPVEYDNQGHRVVRGQYLMQAATDQFLGWGHALGVDYYLRQFRDMKGSARLDRIDLPNAEGYLALCAWTLARAHSRSGDRIAVSAYLGTGDRFDRAIRDFSMAYADQVERDYDLFREAGSSGRLPVADLPI
jgi:uncharacterized protein (DUF2252 family)